MNRDQQSMLDMLCSAHLIMNYIAIELGDGVILIKDECTGEPIGMELLSCRPNDSRFDSVTTEQNQMD